MEECEGRSVFSPLNHFSVVLAMHVINKPNNAAELVCKFTTMEGSVHQD